LQNEKQQCNLLLGENMSNLEKMIYMTWNEAVQTCIDNFEKTNFICSYLKLSEEDKTAHLIETLKACLQKEKHDA